MSILLNLKHGFAFYKRKMSIYGYTRLNNHRPTPDKLDTRNQAGIIRKLSEKKELKLKKIFRDIESNSASLELPNLKKLITLIVQDKVTVLIVARLDRLTRSIRLYKQLLNLFKKHKMFFQREFDAEFPLFPRELYPHIVVSHDQHRARCSRTMFIFEFD